MPIGYRVQKGIPCCANCLFGGYLGKVEEKDRICICEINGKCEDSDYYRLAKEPLGICDAHKSNI